MKSSYRSLHSRKGMIVLNEIRLDAGISKPLLIESFTEKPPVIAKSGRCDQLDLRYLKLDNFQ